MARATVNRALRSLAEAGLLDRRRKTGTRVAPHPAARATLDVTLLREEIEARGARYGYALLYREVSRPPTAIAAALGAPPETRHVHVEALHLADGAPYAIEDRWIDLRTVPEARKAPFETISANEWLLANARYTHGEIAFGAEPASETDAERLGCAPGAALLVLERLTWDEAQAVTRARILFAPGHRMRTTL